MEPLKSIGAKSFLAGMMIGISGIVYLSLENKIAGAFLFSFGLITILVQKLYLFTGLIGYATTLQKIKTSVIALVGNWVGAYAAALIAMAAGFSSSSAQICEQKLALAPAAVFLRAVLCGVMMFLAVDGFKKRDHVIFVMMPIMIFILAGFEHCIANMFYFSYANMWNAKSCLYMLLMIGGNAVGALALNGLMHLKTEVS